MAHDLVNDKATIAVLRSILQKNNILSPGDWFNHTIASGVLWLNTALTFSGKEKSALDYHTRFWAPVVHQIIGSLLEARASQNKATVFVLWGGNAKKLRKVIQAQTAKNQQVLFCEADHPAVQTFFKSGSTFKDINAALQQCGMDPINWAPKN